MAHLVTSAPFRAGHPPVSGQLCETAAEGSGLLSRFPVAFRPASIGFLTIRSRRIGVGPPLRLAYRDGPGPRRGFHVPHGRDPTGEGALCTPGHGVLTTGAWSPVAVAAFQRQALPPALRPI